MPGPWRRYWPRSSAAIPLSPYRGVLSDQPLPGAQRDRWAAEIGGGMRLVLAPKLALVPEIISGLPKRSILINLYPSPGHLLRYCVFGHTSRVSIALLGVYSKFFLEAFEMIMRCYIQ